VKHAVGDLVYLITERGTEVLREVYALA